MWQILFWFRRHLNPTTHGDYPQSMKDHVGDRLPKFTEAQKEKLKNSADFVGINYYSSVFALHDEEPDPSQPSWQSDSLVDWERKFPFCYSTKLFFSKFWYIVFNSFQNIHLIFFFLHFLARFVDKFSAFTYKVCNFFVLS